MNTIIWLALIPYLLASAHLIVMKAGEMRENRNMPLFWRAVTWPWDRLGVAASITFNLIFGWVLFLERPWPVREWTFSNRVRRVFYFPDEHAPSVVRKIREGLSTWLREQINATRKGHI